MPYLTYLSLVEGVRLDYPVLLGRTFTSPFKLQIRHGGLGVDLELFNQHVARLEQLGYANGTAQLTWPLGRMLLHRGDPDLTGLCLDDINEFRRRSTRSPAGCDWNRCATCMPEHPMPGRRPTSRGPTSPHQSRNCMRCRHCCFTSGR